MKPDFPLIDPHVHQWDPYTTPRLVSPLVKLFGRWPWLLHWIARVAFPRAAREFVGQITYVADRYLPAQYAAEAKQVHVEQIVHVQAGWHDADPLAPVGETRWLESLPFESAGFGLGAIVAEASPEAPTFAALLDAHREASSRVAGIRAMAAWHPDPGVHGFHDRPERYRSAAFLEGFAALASRNMTFDAWCYSGQLEDLAVLLSEYPESPVVLDHCGTPAGAFGPVGRFTGRSAGERAAILGGWQEQMARLAAFPNLQVKLSGLLMPVLGHGYAARALPPGPEEIEALIEPVLAPVLDAFGPARCMWSSNFPMDRVSAPLDTIITAYAAVCERHAPGQLPALFRDNAARFYGIS